jgi:tetratricopeptide (TPR) repeat protein
MNLKDLGKNRTTVIILVVAIIGAYLLIRVNREGTGRQGKEEIPQYLTREFAEKMMAQATEEDREVSKQLIEDAGALKRSRLYREAESAYHRAIALYPDGKSYFSYGQYLYEMRRYRLAEESFKLADTLGFSHGQVAFEMAKLFSRLDQPEEALGYVRDAVEDGFATPEMLQEEKVFDTIRESNVTGTQYENLIYPSSKPSSSDTQ